MYYYIKQPNMKVNVRKIVRKVAVNHASYVTAPAGKLIPHGFCNSVHDLPSNFFGGLPS